MLQGIQEARNKEVNAVIETWKFSSKKRASYDWNNEW